MSKFGRIFPFSQHFSCTSLLLRCPELKWSLRWPKATAVAQFCQKNQLLSVSKPSEWPRGAHHLTERHWRFTHCRPLSASGRKDLKKKKKNVGTSQKHTHSDLHTHT